MRSIHILAIAAMCTAAACSKSPTGEGVPTSARRDVADNNAPLQQTNWSPAPPIIPPGAEIVVLQGNPFGSEPYTVRLKFPNGYRIAPHTHPTAENVTVLSGTFLVGDGTQFLDAQLQTFGRDGFFSVPPNHAHFAMARGETVIQLHGIGPVAFNYINPADNPAAR